MENNKHWMSHARLWNEWKKRFQDTITARNNRTMERENDFTVRNDRKQQFFIPITLGDR